MKINAEIDIEWLNEDGKIDAEVDKQLFNAVAEKLYLDLARTLGPKFAKSVEDSLSIKTSQLINTVLEGPITIKKGWNDETDYESIYDMIEQKMTALYEGKIESAHGTCNKDPLLANLENYINLSIKRLLHDVENKVKLHANEAAKKEVSDHHLIKALQVALK